MWNTTHDEYGLLLRVAFSDYLSFCLGFSLFQPCFCVAFVSEPGGIKQFQNVRTVG